MTESVNQIGESVTSIGENAVLWRKRHKRQKVSRRAAWAVSILIFIVGVFDSSKCAAGLQFSQKAGLPFTIQRIPIIDLADDMHAPLFDGKLTHDSLPFGRSLQNYPGFYKQSFRFPRSENEICLWDGLRKFAENAVILGFGGIEAINPITSLDYFRFRASYIGDDKFDFHLIVVGEIIDPEASSESAHGNHSHSNARAVRGDELLTGQVNGSADQASLAITDQNQNEGESSNYSGRNGGEIVRTQEPIECHVQPFHDQPPLYWFPWALLASPFVGSAIALLMIWWGDLWIDDAKYPLRILPPVPSPQGRQGRMRRLALSVRAKAGDGRWRSSRKS